MNTLIISRSKAIRLLNELAYTVKVKEFENLDFILRTRPVDSEIILTDPALIETFHFFDDVGMLDPEVKNGA